MSLLLEDYVKEVYADRGASRATKTQRNLNMPDLTGYDRLAQSPS